jgi:hypothetical protein
VREVPGSIPGAALFVIRPNACSGFNEDLFIVRQIHNLPIMFDDLTILSTITKQVGSCIWAHGVVVSHPLRMRKALGSNPSVSIFCKASKGADFPSEQCSMRYRPASDTSVC